MHLLKERINSSRRKGEVTLFVYYVNLQREEKNANMINMDVPDEKNKEKRNAQARYEIDRYLNL